MATLTTGVVLDLDDTLYLERDYVRSGFDAVGQYLVEAGIMDDFAARAWALFEAGHRNTVFDEVLQAAGIYAAIPVEDLVATYRAHTPNIALCPDAARFLTTLSPDRPLGMITDGPVTSQSAKVRALGLEGRIQHIVLSDQFGIAFRKPHDRPFETIERALGLNPADLTYIGDNPLKDFVTARRRGWHTIRIQRPLGEHYGQPMADEFSADIVIEHFDSLKL